MSNGVKHDQGKIPLDLLSGEALLRIGEVMAFGKGKYGAHNWRGGIAWSRVIGAALRHLIAYNEGEDKDPESGLSHLAHAGCCVHFLLEYAKSHKELDDRYKPEQAKVPAAGAVQQLNQLFQERKIAIGNRDLIRDIVTEYDPIELPITDLNTGERSE